MHWQNSSVFINVSIVLAHIQYIMEIDFIEIDFIAYLLFFQDYQPPMVMSNTAQGSVRCALNMAGCIYDLCVWYDTGLRHLNVSQTASQTIQFKVATRLRRESTHIMCRLYYPSWHCSYSMWLSFHVFQCSWDMIILFRVMWDFKCTVALHGS